jgi:hypothetical protein
MHLPLFPLHSVPGRHLVVTALVLSVALASVVWHLIVERQSIGLEASVGQMRQRLPDPPTASAVEATNVDFAEELPINPSIDPIVREFQRAGTELGVAFVSVSSTPHVATVQTLGRTELTIALRGTYPKLKGVLAVALDRFPALLVQRLSLRRTTAANDLEAHVDLVLLSRPVPASGAGI